MAMLVGDPRRLLLFEAALGNDIGALAVVTAVEHDEDPAGIEAALGLAVQHHYIMRANASACLMTSFTASA